MRKNRMMRAASALLVAVLMTTCTISGTFAKYVTEQTGTDTARVAKWGVQIDPKGNLFFVDYDGKNGGAQDPADTVYSNSAKVVAPGTNGNLTAMTFIGKPEVAFNITYAATLTLDKWKDSSDNYYCPLKITVGTDTFDGTTYASADLFVADVEAAIENYSKDYAPNTNLSTEVDIPSVSWEWPFQTGADDAAKAANNVKDTYLGNQANEGNAPEITLTIKTTIAQLD